MTEPDTFDPSYFGRLFRAEDRHFWFVGRNRIISRFLTTLAERPKIVVEIGCGTGNVLRFVRRACQGATVIGMDLFLEGLSWARKRSRAALVEADLRHHPFKRGIDLVCIFDVLEHIPDDLQALRDIHKVLSPGGRLLMTVPLHPSLWSEFDEMARHVRRYDAVELRRKVSEAGFEIEYASPYIAAALPLMWVHRRFFAARPGSKSRANAEAELKIVPVLNGILRLALRAEESFIARRAILPFGSSMILLARKSERVLS